MKCPSCQERVLRTDGYCKKCSHLLRDVRYKYRASNVYRPRVILLFKFMTGTGAHLRWLGYDSVEFENESSNTGKSLMSATVGGIIHPAAGIAVFASMIRIFILGIKRFFEFILMVFGKYDTDAYGRPVRYFNPNVQKDYTKPVFDLSTVDFSAFSNERLTTTGLSDSSEDGLAPVEDGLQLERNELEKSNGLALQSEAVEESRKNALKSDEEVVCAGGLALQSDETVIDRGLVNNETANFDKVALQSDELMSAGGLALQSDKEVEPNCFVSQSNTTEDSCSLALQEEAFCAVKKDKCSSAAIEATGLSGDSQECRDKKAEADKTTHALSINEPVPTVSSVKDKDEVNQGVSCVGVNKLFKSENLDSKNVNDTAINDLGNKNNCVRGIGKDAESFTKEKGDQVVADNIAPKISAERLKEVPDKNIMVKRGILTAVGICFVALGVYMYPYLTDTPNKAVQKYVNAITAKNYGDMYDLNYTSQDKERDKKELIGRMKFIDEAKTYSADSLYAIAPKITQIRETADIDGQKGFILTTPSGEYALTVSKVAAGPLDLFSKYIVKDSFTFKTVKIKAPSNAIVMVDGSIVDYNGADNTYEYSKAFPGNHKYSISHDLYDTVEGQFETQIDNASEMLIGELKLPLKQEILANASKTSEELLRKIVQSVLTKGGTDAIGYSYENDDSVAKMYNKLIPFFHRGNGSGIGKMDFKNANYQNYTGKVYYKGDDSKFTNFIEMNYSYQKKKGEVLDNRIGYGELQATIEYSIENNRIVPCRIVKWTMKLH